ncbi:MAG: type II toxin-antitoxin system RelE/ParE family toxin [Spirochaetota bacterium]
MSSEAIIESSSEFKIAETGTYRKRIESREFRRYYPRIKETIYPQLRASPYYGPNIKRLKGELSTVFRYRIGDYRLFYTVDADRKLVFILDFAHRKDAYR